MSFRNTHTPRRSEIVGKARYQCPMHKVRGVNAYYLTPELEQHFRRLYPTTLNRDMMRIFGISFVTMQRFKRQLGLTKNMPTILRQANAYNTNGELLAVFQTKSNNKHTIAI